MLENEKGKIGCSKKNEKARKIEIQNYLSLIIEIKYFQKQRPMYIIPLIISRRVIHQTLCIM